MQSRYLRLMVGVILILIITNIFYIFVVLNPQVTSTYLQLSRTNQTDLPKFSGQIIDMYIYNDIIYGIYNYAGGYHIFAYSDQFIFNRKLVNTNNYYETPHIVFVSKMGIFLDIGTLSHYDLQANWVESVQGPPRKLDSGEQLQSQQHQTYMIQSSDAIYKISNINEQVFSPPSTVHTLKYVKIDGWNIQNKNSSDFMEQPDLSQILFLTDYKASQIWDIDLHHSLTSDRLDVLYTDGNDYKLKVKEINLKLNECKVVKTNDITENGNYKNNPSMTYFLLSSKTVISVDSSYSSQANSNFMDIATGQTVSIAAAFQSSYMHLKKIDTTLVYYGAKFDANQLIPILFTISVENNKLVSTNILQEGSVTDLDPISFLTQSGKKLYLATGVLNYQYTSQYQIFIFDHAIKTTVFLPDIHPAVQLNIIGLIIAIFYAAFELYRSRPPTKTSINENLSYPKYID